MRIELDDHNTAGIDYVFTLVLLTGSGTWNGNITLTSALKQQCSQYK